MLSADAAPMRRPLPPPLLPLLGAVRPPQDPAPCCPESAQAQAQSAIRWSRSGNARSKLEGKSASLQCRGSRGWELPMPLHSLSSSCSCSLPVSPLSAHQPLHSSCHHSRAVDLATVLATRQAPLPRILCREKSFEGQMLGSALRLACRQSCFV